LKKARRNNRNRFEALLSLQRIHDPDYTFVRCDMLVAGFMNPAQNDLYKAHRIIQEAQ
jgi:hypothetical protein